ncbi:MAG: hypothetical protein WC871_02220 [Bacteroidales bacterium]
MPTTTQGQVCQTVNSVTIDDIVTIEFGAMDVERAHEWARYMDRKNEGRRTVDLSATKNVTGYLGHLAAERCFDRFGFDVRTTREEKYIGGDRFDLHYDHDYIDVKSHTREFSDQWYFNEKMLVFDHHERKDENYFCFVRVDPTFAEAYVYGFIHARRFWEIARAGEIPPRGRVDHPTPYHFVLSRELLPARNYILRLWSIDRYERRTTGKTHSMFAV